MCQLMLYIADEDFKDADWYFKIRTGRFATYGIWNSIQMQR
jgi:hypothetical protein